MTLLNYWLGVVAKANVSLWRYRINFIPANVLLMLLLGLMLLGLFDAVVEIMNNPTASILDAAIILVGPTGLVGLIILSFVVVMVMQNMVFQVDGSFTQTQLMQTEPPFHVFASARFVLAEDEARTFMDVPAVLAISEGVPVLVSHIDASTRFMGFTTSSHDGIWAVPVRSGRIVEGKFGYQYFGTSRRPAFRFSYVDDCDNKTRTAIIAAGIPSLVVAAGALLQG